jgi:hypothetical protein
MRGASGGRVLVWGRLVSAAVALIGCADGGPGTVNVMGLASGSAVMTASSQGVNGTARVSEPCPAAG